MEKTIIGGQVRIIKDTCDGEYLDILGKTVTVIDKSEEDGIVLYTVVGTGERQTPNPYLEVDTEIVFAGDTEVVEYMELEVVR